MSYDRALTVFSPDGHLFQVEYANEAVKKGSTVCAAKGKEVVAFAVHTKAVPKLQDPRTIRKVLRLDENTVLAFAGLQADARVLVNRTRVELQSYRLNYEDKPTVEYTSRFVARMQQKYTHRGGARPFGLSTLIAGFNSSGEPELYQTDPSGTYYGWKATAIGENHKTPLDMLEAQYKEDMNELDTAKMAIKALLTICEASVENVQVFIMDKNGGHFMENKDLEPLVKELDDTEERMKKLKAAK